MDFTIAPLLNMGDVWVYLLGGPVLGILSFFIGVNLEISLTKWKFKFAAEHPIRNIYIANLITTAVGILLSFVFPISENFWEWFFIAYILTVIIETFEYLWLFKLDFTSFKKVFLMSLIVNTASNTIVLVVFLATVFLITSFTFRPIVF